MAKKSKATAAVAKPVSASVAASPSASPSAEPGTQDSKGKKGKKRFRVPFPGLADDHKIEELEELEKFDSKLHGPIKRGDFKDEAMFYEYKATQMDKAAAALRIKAEDCRKLGSVTDRAKAKKLIAMQRRIAELTEQLANQGVDVDALLSAAETTATP